MSDADNIAQFVNVTGSTPEQASQFLGASNGDLASALSTFFEVQAGQEEDVDAASSNAPPAAASDSDYTGPRTLDGRPAAASEPWPAASRSSSANAPRRTGIATLNSGGASAGAFRQGPAAPSAESDDEPDSEDEDENDDKQDLYAGGGRSGLNVEDPNKRKSGRKMVNEILKKAAQNGPLEPQAPAAGPSWFGGAANTLGSDDTPSQHIPSLTGAGGDAEDDEEVVTRNLTLWANGFSIDDGPLMDYQEHADVLRDLNSGRAPLHLLNVKFGQRVDLQVQKRMQEEYVQQKPAAKPFGGEGNRLGAPTPSLSSTGSTPAASSAGRAQDPDAFMAQTKFELDQTQPITSIQIRTGTGDRMVGRFNHTHTIGDVMNYINAAHPEANTRPYVLQTTFPSRDLTDHSQTVKDAGLLSSVVVCKYV